MILATGHVYYSIIKMYSDIYPFSSQVFLILKNTTSFGHYNYSHIFSLPIENGDLKGRMVSSFVIQLLAKFLS